MSVEGKLYWDDPYKLDFEAEITARADTDERLGIVLDGTYFYPEGGGQPSDRGYLGGAAVVDVQEVDARIVHYLDRSKVSEDDFATGTRIPGKVEADFRKQNMRAHTGAHLLFGAARKLLSALEYAGFDIHGGGGSLYLKTDSPITPELMHRMVEYANEAVVAERAIGTYFVKPEEVARIPGCVWNVKLPEDSVRIVEVDGWDVAVCSGTHLSRSIEVGPLTVTSREAHKKGVTRLDYVVGKAAVSEIVQGERTLGEIGVILNSPREEAASAAQRLVDTITEERKRAEKLQRQLADYQLGELLAGGEIVGSSKLVVGTLPLAGQDVLRPLVAQAAQGDDRLVLVIVGGDDVKFVVAGRNEALDLDLRQPVMEVAARHGGRGGGAPHLVSAGGITSRPEDVVSDLRQALAQALSA